jgi:hypothetical protein
MTEADRAHAREAGELEALSKSGWSGVQAWEVVATELVDRRWPTPPA